MAAKHEKLHNAIQFIDAVRSVDPEMPAQQMRLLLELKKHGECHSTILCENLGMTQQALSRNSKKLGFYVERDPGTNNLQSKGLQLLETFQDPLERRRFVYRLTPKGDAWITTLLNFLLNNGVPT